MARALVNVPASVRRGDVVEVRTQIAHPMETGFRTGVDGARVPRDVLRRFSCKYNGELVVAAELFPAIAANPYFAFEVVATESGTLECTWEGDNGFAHTQTAAITVT